MPALSWVPLSDAAVRRLYTLAKAEKLAPEELAGRILTEYTGTAHVLSVLHGQETAAKVEDASALLEKLERSIEQHGRKHPGNRTGTENIVLASMALIREVNNGGFDQFFRNSPARWADFAPDAMLHVGRPDAGRIARRAVKAVVGRFTTPTEFEDKMSRPNGRRDDALNECDIAFFQLTGLPESVLAYAQKHPDGLLRL